ncbi:hypothetical protein NQ176_g6575 [Zarea fungicola]|uniref:Uncharacterized protein n=1 Tax=Zarea fungicola TaxID=93591 RepID=A0ACC1N4V0_9HYPO|nr:hypothetical protein NQ176_g6575 [Lecanicillium fungicola]
MAGSQLKRLKASLREQGVIGPQQSKKQKRRTAEENRGRNDKRLQRGAILSGIREQFNPFDLKHTARGPKFDVTSNISQSASASKGIQGRPGAAKAAGEERRRETLLLDIQRRNKVGGILDKRFGENDPTMAPEDKMLERFAREKQRAHKRTSMFDLEDDGPIDSLTHGGKSLSFDDSDSLVDDFEEDLDAEDSDGSVREQQRLKRLRGLTVAENGSDSDKEPERKKSKKEVMEEIIAKSKQHKYERQAAKEDDDDMRATIDKELSSIQMLLTASARNKRPGEATEAATIAGVERGEFDRNFDMQVKRLAQDRRAQPQDRTKTEEEILEDKSKRLRELEEKRQRRMRGEEVSDSDESEENKKGKNAVRPEDQDDMEDDEDFGLGEGIRTRTTATEMGLDDEDDFLIEDDLVASGSDLEFDSGDESDDESGNSAAEDAGDIEEDDEFTKGILNDEESKNPVFHAASAATTSTLEKGDEHGLPFTFSCPETLEELQSITVRYPHESTPKIVQRVRALYHPKLDARNKERLGNFAKALVDYVAAPWDAATAPPASVIESVVRHIHSLAKMFPVEISNRFRYHLQDMSKNRHLSLEPSDLLLLSAVGSIFPTSDHFHQVVTPAMLTIGRYVSQRVPKQLSDFATGTFLCILSLQYQQLAKRYVPEVISFSVNTLCALAPLTPATTQITSTIPIHEYSEKRFVCSSTEIRRLRFTDCVPTDPEASRPRAEASQISGQANLLLSRPLHPP